MHISLDTVEMIPYLQSVDLTGSTFTRSDNQ
jgi:hypothetical protein